MKLNLSDYIQLTKPRVMILVILSGAAALVLEKSLLQSPWQFLLLLAGLYLSGGSANALNMYFERDLDAKMTRTRNRRPIPRGRIKPENALVFSVVIGIMAVVLFALVFNLFSALLALGTILFYGIIYTLILKPGTEHNIVIGGAAGAMAPVIAWVASAGEIRLTPAILFLIIMVWTPPHFWALALYFKDDYEKVGLPMLPNVKGEKTTLTYILSYSIALLAVSFALMAVQAGIIYLSAALILGFVFIKKSIAARKMESAQENRGLFAYSIVYLFALFFAMIFDSLIL